MKEDELALKHGAKEIIRTSEERGNIKMGKLSR
jgi:hypothetical protein